jgi:hypothetical protein
MRVRDTMRSAGDHELLMPPKVCTIDKHGRIYAGVDYAKKKGLLLFIALSDEELAELEKQ